MLASRVADDRLRKSACGYAGIGEFLWLRGLSRKGKAIRIEIAPRETRLTMIELPEQRPEGDTDAPVETRGFVFNQTMLRIKDPKRSLPFYQHVLGMTLVKVIPFPEMAFTLYFLGYVRREDALPADPEGRLEYAFGQPAMLELTHNHGTENHSGEPYHSGNSDPRGFGHIGLAVPDVNAACARFEKLGVEFVKRPNEGSMKGLAFIKDPDGYWIEILNPANSALICGGEGNKNI